jgi:uncharacterized membrane protein (TIGR02234 family)
VLVCLALLGGAAALEGGARLPWFTAGVDAVGRGTVTVTATGADLVPAVSAVALLALAAVAAAVALAGLPRRVLGGLVAAAGVGVGVAVARLFMSPPTPSDLAALPGAPAGGTTAAGSASPQLGALVAVLGALLLVLAGVAVIVREPRLPRLGARYAARAVAGEAATDPDRAADPDHAADPDRAAWDALDAGRDPTTDRASSSVESPTEPSTGPSTGPSAGPSAAPSAAPSTQPAARPHTDPPTRSGRTDRGGPGRAV